jgi:hypothetical protein
VLVEVVPCFIVFIGFVGTMSTCFLVVDTNVCINVGCYIGCCFTAPPTTAIEDVSVASFSNWGVTSFLGAFQKTCAACLVISLMVVAFPTPRLSVGVGSKLQ